jgi:hypothetical protein
MIVRDEEACLARCLTSVKEEATELIVVDTGSKDRTREIAQGFGAKVFEFAWTGDFSEARNVSLAHATGDWVLWLDADEELAPGAGSAIRSLLTTTTAAGIQLTVRSHNPPGETTLYEDGTITRLLRNRAEHRFEGAIHEQIGPSIVRAGGQIEAVPSIVIMHHGYASSMAQGQDRARRNLQSLELALAGQPNDAYLRFHLGATSQAAGDAARAEQELLRAIELNRGELSQMLTATALCKLAQLALARGDDSAAADRAKRALALDGHNAVALQVLGVALAQRGDMLGAKAAFAALARDPRVTPQVRDFAERLVKAL